jgi:Gpi18-like mannosyltransferase
MLKIQYLKDESFLFAGKMWLYSRILLCIAMLLIAPLLPAPANGVTATFSWDNFTAWDSYWYKRIINDGYQFVNNGQEYSVAFFPLYPLLIRGLMFLGLPFEPSGILINTVGFIGALIILYKWVEERHDKNTARLATAALAWCPMSVYGTVVYTEGLFLLTTTAALWAFDNKKYTWAAFWGALSTAARSPGLALIPAFIFVAWKEKREIKAYLSACFSAVGILLFSLYCHLKFNDALAFIHVQKAWRSSAGFAWEAWWKVLQKIFIGPVNVNAGYLKDPWYPLIFLIILISIYLLWRFRNSWNSSQVSYGFMTLFFLLWVHGGDPFIKTLYIFGSAYLLWSERKNIPTVALIYGLFSFGLILNTGLNLSVERYVYGIISVSYGYGILLAKHPRYTGFSMFFCALILGIFAVRFSQKIWLS